MIRLKGTVDCHFEEYLLDCHALIERVMFAHQDFAQLAKMAKATQLRVVVVVLAHCKIGLAHWVNGLNLFEFGEIVYTAWDQ